MRKLGGIWGNCGDYRKWESEDADGGGAGLGFGLVITWLAGERCVLRSGGTLVVGVKFICALRLWWWKEEGGMRCAGMD